MKNLFRYLIPALALAAAAPAAVAAPTPAAPTADEESIYHEAFRRLHAAGQFNGAVLIAKDGEVLLDACFGDADVAEGRPLAADSLYRLASVSKTITATALLSLVDAGKLALDDKVQDRLPAFPYPDITLRQLLQHSSGLPDYIFGVGDAWDEAKGPMTNQAVLDWLAQARPALAFAPGQGWEYSNTGYALLPLVIARAAGTPYPDYVRGAVFAKAGMADSVHISGLGAVDRARVAAGHGFDYATGQDVRVDRHPVLSREFDTDQVFGAGDIYATARDLYAFDRALKAGKLVSAGLQAQAYTSLVLPEGFPAGYGLGWQVAESEYTGRIIHHHGDGDGYRTRFYRFIDKDITIVVLENAREKYADDAVRVAQQLAFKGMYTLPSPSLAEAAAREAAAKGPDAAIALIAAAAADPAPWSLDKRDLDNLALTWWFQGKQDLAIRFFTAYLALMPDDPRVHSTLAEALEEAGDHAAATARYATALEVAKRDPGKYAREIAELEKRAAAGD